MKLNWRNKLIKITIWLVVEVFLNLMGLDNIADYGEFVFGRYEDEMTSFLSSYIKPFESYWL